MDVARALSQVAEIHKHLSRTEVYRGYRSQTIAFTGGVALLGTAIQPVVHPLHGLDQVRFWVAVAAINLLIVGLDIAWDYHTHYSKLQRKISTTAVGQFLPALAVGAAVTFVLMSRAPDYAGLLPGLWALIYSMGIFASRPFLPQGVGWVGLFYFLAGTYLLLTAKLLFDSPILMGGVFGLGQLSLSAVLYWNLERNQDE